MKVNFSTPAHLQICVAGHQSGHLACHVNVIHKIKMPREMTLFLFGLQLNLMCGHLLGLNSPNATFPSKFLTLVFQTWKLSYPLPQPPSFSTPYLWWIDCHDRLLASTTIILLSPSCLVSFTSCRDLCDECGQSTIPWGINRCKAFKRLPI